MPSFCNLRLLVVATGLCSALAGKAFNVSLSNVSLLSSLNLLISDVKDSSVLPVDDPNHHETLGQYLDTHPIVWLDGKWLDTIPKAWLGNESSALQLIWQDGRNSFNITMDSCLPMDTIVGIYQFANGTSKNDTTLYEISQDLLQFAFSEADGPTHRLARFASQTLANAQIAESDIDAFLDDHTLCDSVSDGVSDSSSDHTELRRLLAVLGDQADGYWVSVTMKATAAGLTTGLALGIGSSNTTFTHQVAAGAIASLAVIVYGSIDRAQRQGRMNWLGGFVGNVFSSLTRRILGSIDTVSVCDSDIESNIDGVEVYDPTAWAIKFPNFPQGSEFPNHRCDAY